MRRRRLALRTAFPHRVQALALTDPSLERPCIIAHSMLSTPAGAGASISGQAIPIDVDMQVPV